MNRIVRNISIILRSERMIAHRHLLALRKQTGLLVTAGGVAIIGVIMLNLSAYFAMAETLSPAVAALIVAMVNLALAGILAFAAMRVGASGEVAPVAELRDMALEDIEAELQDFAAEARAVSDSVKKMAKNPFGEIAPEAAAAVAKMMMKNLKG